MKPPGIVNWSWNSVFKYVWTFEHFTLSGHWETPISCKSPELSNGDILQGAAFTTLGAAGSQWSPTEKMFLAVTGAPWRTFCLTSPIRRVSTITVPETKRQQNIQDSTPGQRWGRGRISFCSGANFLYSREMKNEHNHKVRACFLLEYLSSLYKLV